MATDKEVLDNLYQNTQQPKLKTWIDQNKTQNPTQVLDYLAQNSQQQPLKDWLKTNRETSVTGTPTVQDDLAPKGSLRRIPQLLGKGLEQIGETMESVKPTLEKYTPLIPNLKKDIETNIKTIGDIPNPLEKMTETQKEESLALSRERQEQAIKSGEEAVLMNIPIEKIVGPVIGWVGKTFKKGISGVLGASTSVGSRGVEEAIKGSEAFKKTMRGEISAKDVANNVETALDKVVAKRGEAYRTAIKEMQKPGGDWERVKFPVSDIQNNAITELKKYGVETGGTSLDLGTTQFSGKGADVVQQTLDKIAEFSKKAKDGNLSVEQMDTLKQNLFDQWSTLKSDTTASAKAKNYVKDLAFGISDKLDKEVAGYKELTSKYKQASAFIDEIKDSLAVGKGKSPDAVLKKLQAALKDEKNPMRADLVEALSKEGGEELSAQAAGLAMQRVAPTHLATIGDGIAFALSHMNPSTLLLLATASPRVVGETLLAYAKAAHAMKAVGEVLPPVVPAMVSRGLAAASVKTPEQRQNGGPIESGKPYIVGEQGPEVVVPQQSGTVIPNPMSIPQIPNTRQNALGYLTQSIGSIKGKSTAEVIKGASDYMKLPIVEQELTGVGKAARTIFYNALQKVIEKDSDQYSKAKDFMDAVIKKYGSFLTVDPIMKLIVDNTMKSLKTSSENKEESEDEEK